MPSAAVRNRAERVVPLTSNLTPAGGFQGGERADEHGCGFSPLAFCCSGSWRGRGFTAGGGSGDRYSSAARRCRLARHQLDRRRSCLGVGHRIDVSYAMTAILVAINGVDLVEDGGIGVGKGNVFLDAAGVDAAFVANLSATKPGGGAPVGGSDVEIVAKANDPDCHRLSQRSIAPERCDPQFGLRRRSCPVRRSSRLSLAGCHWQVASREGIGAASVAALSGR